MANKSADRQPWTMNSLQQAKPMKLRQIFFHLSQAPRISGRRAVWKVQPTQGWQVLLSKDIQGKLAEQLPFGGRLNHFCYNWTFSSWAHCVLSNSLV